MSIELRQIYRCDICKNAVEVTSIGGGELSCCDQPMRLLAENVTDGAVEKHVPLILESANGNIEVKVGEIDHPMIVPHHIEWIEIFNDHYLSRKYLRVDELATVEFLVPYQTSITARAYCNLHELWVKRN